MRPHLESRWLIPFSSESGGETFELQYSEVLKKSTVGASLQSRGTDLVQVAVSIMVHKVAAKNN